MSLDRSTDSLEALLSKWNGMNVVGYILATSGRDEVTSDRHGLQGIFRRLKEEASEIELDFFSDFVFATRDVFPFSRELERALTYLSLGGLLITDNPEFVRFRVQYEERVSVKQEAAKIFTEQEIAALDCLARKFASYLAEWDEANT